MAEKDKGTAFCSVTTHEGQSRLVNDPSGTRSVLFDHMATKLATVLASVKGVETVEGARLAMHALNDLAYTIRACSQAFHAFEQMSEGEEVP